VLLQFLTQFLFYTHFITIVMPPGPVSCIGGTKYPHFIVLYCIWPFEIIQDGGGRHLGFVRIENTAIRSPSPKTPP